VFRNELNAAAEIRLWIEKQIYGSREKDYHNPFKRNTFRNKTEMELVLGKPEDNPFIKIVQKETIAFNEMIKRVLARLSA